MSIWNCLSSKQPREKLMEHGAQTWSNAKLLVVFFGTGRLGPTAVDLTHPLWAPFGSLGDLLRTDHQQGPAGPGPSPARYCLSQAALELSRRRYRKTLQAGPALDSCDTARGCLLAQLRDRPYEVFCCLHLHTRHQLIAFEELFRSTIQGASVQPREVANTALARNAAAMILAHNRPLCGIAASPPRGAGGPGAGRVPDRSTVP